MFLVCGCLVGLLCMCRLVVWFCVSVGVICVLWCCYFVGGLSCFKAIRFVNSVGMCDSCVCYVF